MGLVEVLLMQLQHSCALWGRRMNMFINVVLQSQSLTQKAGESDLGIDCS